MKTRARQLRRKITEAEKWLWNCLRNREMAGCKFRRQRPIGPYIVDFVCLEKKIVIEIDGGQHAEKAVLDENRSNYLREKGYKVIRFWNNDVLQNGEGVLNAIYDILSR